MGKTQTILLMLACFEEELMAKEIRHGKSSTEVGTFCFSYLLLPPGLILVRSVRKEGSQPPPTFFPKKQSEKKLEQSPCGPAW